jgi:hypothetical protein
MKSTLLRNKEGGEGGEGAPLAAKTNAPVDNSLPTLGISDALEFLEVPETLKQQVAKEEGKPAKPAAAKPAAPAAKADEGKSKAGEQEGAEGAEGDDKGKEAATAPEFSAEQQAWLDKRNAATDAKEIAKLDAAMPEFSQEQADYLNAKADEAEPGDGEKKADEEIKAPEFTDEQKPFVEKLTTELTETKTKLTALESKRSELEVEVARLANTPPPVAGNLHPLALTDNPADIDTHEKNLEEFVAWGKANWDGADEVKDDSGKVTQRAYTAKEIREAVTRRETELRKLIPAARETYQQRMAQLNEAKKIYPVLFDAKSEEAKLASAFLKQWPVLKAIPNVMTIIGDAIAGERARAAAAAGANKKPILRIPAKPVRATAGTASRVAVKPKADKTPTAERFIAAKKTAATEVDALARVMEGY